LQHALALRHSLAKISRKKLRFHAMSREHLRQLHVEKKTRRRFFAPSSERAHFRQRVKRGVHFHVIEMLGVPPEPFARGKFGRIPILDESRISPTRRADANVSHETMVTHAGQHQRATKG
jgi:hypothetical protein